jgi:hypothetical protein
MPWDRTDTRHHHPRIRLPAETYANPDAVVHVTVCTLGGQPVFRRPEQPAWSIPWAGSAM